MNIPKNSAKTWLSWAFAGIASLVLLGCASTELQPVSGASRTSGAVCRCCSNTRTNTAADNAECKLACQKAHNTNCVPPIGK